MALPDPSTSLAALLDSTDWLRRLARELVRDAQRAEELVQATLVLAHERPPRDPGRIRAWAREVMASLVREERRAGATRAHHERAAAREEAARSTLALVERAETQRLLVEAVLGLDEPYRSTVLLRHFEGLPPRRIAARLDVPLATVTSRLSRAHARLRERLRAEHPERSWLAVLVPLLDRPLAATTLLPLALMNAKLPLVAALLIALAAGLVSQRRSAPPEEAPAVAAPEERAPEPGAPAEPASPARALAGSAAATERSIPAQSADEAAGTLLSGRVLMPDGEPAAGARVVQGDLAAVWQADRGEAPPGHAEARADDEGRFELRDLAPGFARLTALAEGAAPSATFELRLEPGERREDLTLELRRGARLVALVLGLDGQPVAGRAVRLLQTDTHRVRNLESDAHGRLVADHLNPGVWGLASYPDDDELRAAGHDARAGAGLVHLVQATVELADGEERFVLLGAPPATPILVRGVVTCAGAPQQAILQWMRPGADALASQQLARAGKDGRFELELAAPGDWHVGVAALGGRSGRMERWIELPRVAEHELELALPTGSLRGRVVDAAGAPLEGARVLLHLERGGAWRSPLALGGDQLRTDAEGRFAFDLLESGTYLVAALGMEATEERPPLGGALAHVEVGPGEVVEDVELALAEGHAVRGTALDANGQPVYMAAVFVHDAAGMPVHPIACTHADEAGGFVTPPLAPGVYRLRAVKGGLVGETAGELAVALARAPAPVELVLAPGGTLALEGAAGAQPGARPFVELRAADGRALSGLRDARDPWSSAARSFGGGLFESDPLVPGDYSIAVIWPDGRVTALEATLTAPVREVLRLER